MFTPAPMTRRTFLADLGRGSVALVVVGIAGCAPGSTPSATPSAASGRSPEPGTPSPPASDSAGAPSSSGGGSGGAPSSGAVAWTRVNLGFVSAYALVRGGEAAIVDTGVAGSADEIEQALSGAGLGWDAVGHVILTHRHGDHAGSAADVLDRATAATGYAGDADIPGITAPRPLTAVADGDMVFGLRIVTTPGHTAGHVAVLDEVGGILVAGDALGTVGGTLAGSNPSFTADPAAARASVAKMGALRFETLLVGHGEPILSGASAQVAALAASG
jgi:glyoxylase-like metal-dependent hydrolase (beta-lactamase superfamily II)